jgi:hypothetical protein
MTIERDNQQDMQRMYDKFKRELENETEHKNSNIPDFYRNLMAWCVENGANPT